MMSFLNYVGGKSLLANTIIPKIPEHHTYVEVFAGAAWLLFKKTAESKVEVLNDINTELVNLYRVIKLHLEEFVRYLKWILVARDEFERFKKEDPATLTDIQRAVRFYYLLRAGYGGKIVQPSFGAGVTRPSSLNLLRIEEDLSAAHLRLSRVTIENQPYQKILERMDRPETFFYLDPPYFQCEDYYGRGIFARADFERLRDIMKGLKGKFILSINDEPEIRRIYQDFSIETVKTSYALAGADKKKKVSELLITNF
jgi:DNA adenine methylase